MFQTSVKVLGCRPGLMTRQSPDSGQRERGKGLESSCVQSGKTQGTWIIRTSQEICWGIILLVYLQLAFLLFFPSSLPPATKMHTHAHTDTHVHMLLFFSSFPFHYYYYFFCLFRAAPKAYGGSQVRGWIAVAASLYHNHSNTRSELLLWPTPQLMATPDP